MSVNGTYKITMQTPMGAMSSDLTLNDEGGQLSGKMASDQFGENAFSSGTVEGNAVKFDLEINAMGQSISLSCEAAVDGDTIKGTMNSPMGGAEFSGTKEG